MEQLNRILNDNLVKGSMNINATFSNEENRKILFKVAMKWEIYKQMIDRWGVNSNILTKSMFDLHGTTNGIEEKMTTFGLRPNKIAFLIDIVVLEREIRVEQAQEELMEIQDMGREIAGDIAGLKMDFRRIADFLIASNTDINLQFEELNIQDMEIMTNQMEMMDSHKATMSKLSEIDSALSYFNASFFELKNIVKYEKYFDALVDLEIAFNRVQTIGPLQEFVNDRRLLKFIQAAYRQHPLSVEKSISKMFEMMIGVEGRPPFDASPLFSSEYLNFLLSIIA